MYLDGDYNGDCYKDDCYNSWLSFPYLQCQNPYPL